MDDANLLPKELQKQSELSSQLLEIKHDLRKLLACEISESDKSQALVWTYQAEAFLNGIESLDSAYLVKRRNKLLKNIAHLRSKLVRTTQSVYSLPLQSISRSRQPASKLVHSQSVQQQDYSPQISHSTQILFSVVYRNKIERLMLQYELMINTQQPYGVLMRSLS